MEKFFNGRSRSKSTKHHLANSMTDDDTPQQTVTLGPNRKDSSLDLQGPEQLHTKDSSAVTKFNIFHRRQVKSKTRDSTNKKNSKSADKKAEVVQEVITNKEQIQIKACPSKKHVEQDGTENAVEAKMEIENFPQDTPLGEEREQSAVVSSLARTKFFTNTPLKDEMPTIFGKDGHEPIVQETKPKRRWLLSDKFKKNRTLGKETKQEALVQSSRSTPEPQQSMPTATTSVITLHHNSSFQNTNASSNCAIRRSTPSFSNISNISTKEPEKPKPVKHLKLETIFKRCDEMLENASRVKFEAKLNETIKKQRYEKSFRTEIIAQSADRAENLFEASLSDDKTVTSKEEEPPARLSSNDNTAKQQIDMPWALDQTIRSALTAISETMAPRQSLASAINSEGRSPKDMPSSASKRTVTQTEIEIGKKRRSSISTFNTAKDVSINKQSKIKATKPTNKDKQNKISKDSVTINKRVAKAAPPLKVKNNSIKKEIKQIVEENADALKSLEFYEQFQATRRNQVNASSSVGRTEPQSIVGNKLLEENVTNGFSSVTFSNTRDYSPSQAKPKMEESSYSSADALYSSSSMESKGVKTMYSRPMKPTKVLLSNVDTTYSSLQMKSRDVKKRRLSNVFTERDPEIIAPPLKAKASFYKSKAFRANAITNFIIGSTVSQELYGLENEIYSNNLKRQLEPKRSHRVLAKRNSEKSLPMDVILFYHSTLLLEQLKRNQSWLLWQGRYRTINFPKVLYERVFVNDDCNAVTAIAAVDVDVDVDVAVAVTATNKATSTAIIIIPDEISRELGGDVALHQKRMNAHDIEHTLSEK
uniref:Uncharacterized protein n=1 Tax=Glossina austeni TaxID=7395 RepID=A0A1A9VPN1_GLOAU